MPTIRVGEINIEYYVEGAGPVKRRRGPDLDAHVRLRYCSVTSPS